MVDPLCPPKMLWNVFVFHKENIWKPILHELAHHSIPVDSLFPDRKCVCGKPGWMRCDIVITLRSSLCCLSPHEKHCKPSVIVICGRYCSPKGLKVFITFSLISISVSHCYTSLRIICNFNLFQYDYITRSICCLLLAQGGDKRAYLYTDKNLIIQLGTVLNE